ncbi:MAG: alpha/beta fold hydrolase [Arenicella sp.]
MTLATEKLMIRGLQHHIQRWGDHTLPTVFALHGWMDCGISFAEIAKQLSNKFHIIAPDLRGFGDTEHSTSGYWFPDYCADLDAMINHYAPHSPANLLGHSMGGNIALMYAGIKPHRVSKVLSLEALGLPSTSPQDTPKKYAQWIEQSNTHKKQKHYPSLQALQQAIQANHPSLSEEMVKTLARTWGKPLHKDSQKYVLKHDAKHRHANPIRYHHEDMEALWEAVTAKTGVVMANDSNIYQQYLSSGRIEKAKKLLNITDKNYYIVDEAQHMLHLEQPKSTAAHVAHFFSSE